MQAFSLPQPDHHSELDFMRKINQEILNKTFSGDSTTTIVDSKYFYLYSDLVETQKSEWKSNVHPKPSYKQNKLVDNFLFLKRIYLEKDESVEDFLIFLDLFLLNQYRNECKSYSILAYRLRNSSENNKENKILDIIYQEEMDMIVTYPILEDYFLHFKKSQGLNNKEKERLFEVICSFILALKCNYIEKIDCFYARLDYLYHIEHGEKRYAIKFSKDDDLNEFYFVNKLRIQYEHLKKAVQTDLSFSLPQRVWALVAISKRFFQLKFNKEALNIIEETLEMRKELWGPNHFETFDSWSRMAASLFREKEYDCALEIYQNVLVKRKEIFPEFDKPILLTMYNLATVCLKQKLYELALEQFEKIEGVLKRAHRVENNFLNDILLGKATCCLYLNRLDRGIQTYEEILGNNEGVSMVEQLKIPLILNNLSVCYKKKNDFVKYYSYKLEAYMIIKEIKGEDKPKKKELEEIFKNYKFQKLYYEILVLKGALKPIFKRKLIIEDIINHLI